MLLYRKDTKLKGFLQLGPMDVANQERRKMSDGTIITYRRYTRSDNLPAVDINIRKSTDSGGIKSQKIHFVKGGERK